MKSGTSVPGKRDETLRSTLIEFAKKVSFPNWNAMHGVENARVVTTEIAPIVFNAVNDNVINCQHTTDSAAITGNSLKDSADACVTMNNGSAETVQESCKSNSSEGVNLPADDASDVVDGIINGERSIDSLSVITPQTPNHSQDSMSDAQSVSNVNPSRVLASEEIKSEAGIPAHVNAREFSTARPELSRTRSDSDVLRNVSNQMDTTQDHDTLQTDDEMAKRPFRKKSMSFAGTLPIRIEVTQDKIDSDAAESSSLKLFQKQVKEVGPVRYDRFMSVGDASASIRRSPKSPRRNRKSVDKKVNDPSHYLGRRRGSYNPTYEQTQVALPTKGKERYNQRARSLFVGTTVSEDEFRKSLASRLMKVASPALRESLSEENEPMEEQITETVIDTVSEKGEEYCPQASNKENGSSLSANDLRRRKSSPISQIVASKRTEDHVNINNNPVDKPLKIMMRRRPWENSSGGAVLSKPVNTQSSRQIMAGVENERNSAYFSIACNSSRERARRPLDNQSSVTTKTEHSARNNPQHNGVKYDSKRGLSNGKASSQFEEVNLMKRYQRQSRSKSCFGSLQPSTFSDSDYYDGSHSRRSHDPSSSSSSDEGGKESGYTIHVAAKAGKLKRLKKLVENGVDVNLLDDNSWPAIHYALLGGHFNCVAYLLTKGADIRHYSKGRTLKYFK